MPMPMALIVTTKTISSELSLADMASSNPSSYGVLDARPVSSSGLPPRLPEIAQQAERILDDITTDTPSNANASHNLGPSAFQPISKKEQLHTDDGDGQLPMSKLSAEPHAMRADVEVLQAEYDHLSAPLMQYEILLQSHDLVDLSLGLPLRRGLHQDRHVTNLISVDCPSPSDSASASHGLEHDFRLNADEFDSPEVSSSPPTSSPSLLFASSSLPSSQSSAIQAAEDSDNLKEELSFHQTEDSDEVRDIDMLVSRESSAPAVGVSSFAFPTPQSFPKPDCSSFDHFSPDGRPSSQDSEDPEFEPIMTDKSMEALHSDLSFTSSPQRAHTWAQEPELASLSPGLNATASEVIPSATCSPVPSPRPTPASSSLPPSSPASSSLHPSSPPPQPLCSPLEDAGSFHVEDARTAPPGSCAIDGEPVSSLILSEQMLEVTYPELVDVEAGLHLVAGIYSDYRRQQIPIFDFDSQPLRGKRKAEDQSIDVRPPYILQNESRRATIADDVAPDYTSPNPKRPTIAAQKLQHKKLTTPFRSPLIKRPKLAPASQGPPPQIPSTLRNEEPNISIEQTPPPAVFPEPDKTDPKKRYRTQRAAAQFKSPLSVDASSKLASSVRMTPTIQVLERQLHLLKRAVKVKQDGDEKTLQALVKKWTEAGREIAWEVWELVKDNASTEDQGWGNPQSKGKPRKSALEDSWGWNEKSGEKNQPSREYERNWGWDVVPVGDSVDTENIETGRYEREIEDDDLDEKKQDTLGTMLMQLGIAPETLGWNEEDGTFQDE
ncbi:hypothetical protein D9615_000168 [Tricholomella constricta]|uniref:Uncharacterized protein n=1 Tax=Tricholomella constricta TaxID=117010 RepID=A0A8H5HQR0_9AGAR|nr:hypothetical protein D9615_000168 [Tricholomella constricta]